MFVILNLTEAEAAHRLGLLGPYMFLTLKYIVQIKFFKDSGLEEKVVEWNRFTDDEQ